MTVQTTDEVKDAIELLVNSSLVDQVEAAYLLLRVLSTDEDIGVVGRGFLRESCKGVAAVLDWIAVGKQGALRDTRLQEMATGEVSL
jgi:hypothetical protein